MAETGINTTVTINNPMDYFSLSNLWKKTLSDIENRRKQRVMDIAEAILDVLEEVDVR